VLIEGVPGIEYRNTIAMHDEIKSKWEIYIERYRNGEWRAPIFRDMIVADAEALRAEQRELTFLDIGCGGGFDSDQKLQNSLVQMADHYLGIEPDPDIKLGEKFHRVFRTRFEDAAIEENSIDIAFSFMVLEHVEFPEFFYDKLYRVLKKNGVFWGFTVDTRHWFVLASALAQKLHIKDWYLNQLHGKRGEKRYENYPVFYRSNNPKRIERYTQAFSSRTILNFYRVGQLDYYFPVKLRWIGRTLDRLAIRMGCAGSLMAIRLTK
jgi:SAM-dependent methyltransferase